MALNTCSQSPRTKYSQCVIWKDIRPWERKERKKNLEQYNLWKVVLGQYYHTSWTSEKNKRAYFLMQKLQTQTHTHTLCETGTAVTAEQYRWHSSRSSLTLSETFVYSCECLFSSLNDERRCFSRAFVIKKLSLTRKQPRSRPRAHHFQTAPEWPLSRLTGNSPSRLLEAAWEFCVMTDKHMWLLL